MTRLAAKPGLPGSLAPAWAIGYVAIRPGDPSGARPQEVRHGVEMIPGDSEAAALRVGLVFALFKLPVAEGWTGHEAVSCPSDQRLRTEGQWK